MGFLKKTKDGLNDDLNAIKTNKKIKADQSEIQKKLKEANDKQQKEISKIKAADISKTPTEKNYHAIIRLVITSGSSVEEIAELGSTFGHKEGKQTLKVVNRDNEVIFEEYKPDWQNKFKFLDKDTLQEKITDLKNTLKAFQKGEIKQKKDKTSDMVYYEEDYLAMLRQAEQDFAILTLGSDGSYSSFKNGVPVYTFEIIGFFKIPLFHYTDKSILGLPPAPKIVIGQYLTELLYKNYKADETKAERIMLTIFSFALAIALIGCVFIMWKAMGMTNIQAISNQVTADNLASLFNVSDMLGEIISNTNTTNNLLTVDNTKPVQNLTNVIK